MGSPPTAAGSSPFAATREEPAGSDKDPVQLKAKINVFEKSWPGCQAVTGAGRTGRVPDMTQTLPEPLCNPRLDPTAVLKAMTPHSLPGGLTPYHPSSHQRPDICYTPRMPSALPEKPGNHPSACIPKALTSWCPPASPASRPHAPRPCPPLPSSVRPPREQRRPRLVRGHQLPTPDTCFQASLSHKEGRHSGQLGQGSKCSKPHFCHRFGKNWAPSLLKWTRATCPENSVLCTADLERAKSGLSDEYSWWEHASPQQGGKSAGGIKLSCKMKQKIVLSSK